MSLFTTVCCAVATVGCAVAGFWLIGSDKLNKSPIRPVKFCSVIYVFALLNIMILGDQIGSYLLDLDRADRVDVSLGTALGATFGAVTGSLYKAIYTATENYNLARLPYPLLMLAIGGPEVIITPLQDETGSYRHGLLAYIAGFAISVVMTEVSRRRASSNFSQFEWAEPLRLGRRATLFALMAAALAIYVSLDFLSLTQAEQDRLIVFILLGSSLGFVAERAGSRVGSPAVALVASVILTLSLFAAISVLGRNLVIPWSDPKTGRAVMLVGLIVGVMLATLAERGLFAQLRRPTSGSQD